MNNMARSLLKYFDRNRLRRIFFGKSQKIGLRQIFRAYLVASLILTVPYIFLVPPSDNLLDSSPTTKQTQGAKNTTPKTIEAEKVETTTEKPKEDTFENSKKAPNGGLSKQELLILDKSQELLYEYVNLYAGFVVGNVTSADMEFGCATVDNSYQYLSPVYSESAYFDDLLDRAKDYFYETGSLCTYAFKKNRLSDLRESAEYAATSIAFIKRILREGKANN